jgi:hypothetical protein
MMSTIDPFATVQLSNQIWTTTNKRGLPKLGAINWA